MIIMIMLNLKRKRGCELWIKTNIYVLEKDKNHFYYCSGSNSSMLYGGEHFMDKEVVLVAINYR